MVTAKQRESGQRVGLAYGGHNRGYRAPHLARTQEPTIKDIVWAAGFIEGDGSFYASGSRAVTETIQATQLQSWPLDWLAQRFGGRVRKMQGTGYLEGQEPNHWQISGARARGLMMSIYELMSPKRQEQIRKVMRTGEFR